jgi:hypothetical protein
MVPQINQIGSSFETLPQTLRTIAFIAPSF